MIGMTYEVTPLEGPPWRFRSTLAHEVAWEAHARKVGLPMQPQPGNVEAFPLATNSVVLAWFDAGRPDDLETFARSIRAVLPVDDDDDAAGLPDPTPGDRGDGSAQSSQ